MTTTRTTTRTTTDIHAAEWPIWVAAGGGGCLHCDWWRSISINNELHCEHGVASRWVISMSVCVSVCLSVFVCVSCGDSFSTRRFFGNWWMSVLVLIGVVVYVCVRVCTWTHCLEKQSTGFSRWSSVIEAFWLAQSWYTPTIYLWMGEIGFRWLIHCSLWRFRCYWRFVGVVWRRSGICRPISEAPFFVGDMTMG